MPQGIHIRQDLQDFQDYFPLDHFPDESDPTQSACGGILFSYLG